jgi:hypothetical protein
MFREIMAIRTPQMMTSRSLICLLENQNRGKFETTRFETWLSVTVLSHFIYHSKKRQRLQLRTNLHLLTMLTFRYNIKIKSRTLYYFFVVVGLAGVKFLDFY